MRQAFGGTYRQTRGSFSLQATAEAVPPAFTVCLENRRYVCVIPPCVKRFSGIHYLCELVKLLVGEVPIGRPSCEPKLGDVKLDCCYVLSVLGSVP